MLEQKYKPTLSDLVNLSFVPPSLSFINESLNQILDKFYYHNFRSQTSFDRTTASYYLEVIYYKELSLFEIPGTGLKVVVNPPDPDDAITGSTFDVSLFYKWQFLKYIKDPNIATFDFKPKSFLLLAMEILGLDFSSLITQTSGNFHPSDNPQTSLDLFVEHYNNNHTPVIDNYDSVADVVNQIRLNHNLIDIIVDLYLTSLDDLATMLKTTFGAISSKEIKDILIPEIAFSINNISIGIQLPRKVFIPLDEDGNPIPDPAKSYIVFNAGSLHFSTSEGIIFDSDPSFDFQKSEILNSGFTIEINQLKLDLSDTSNILEAELDNRPTEFRGVYIQEAVIGLPPKWIQDDSGSTAELFANNMLVGTGGISGTIGLRAFNPDETNPTVGFTIGQNGFYIGLNDFSLTFQQNTITQSTIRGQMRIPNFKDADGNNAEINIDVNIGTDGDFKITASEAQGIQVLQIENIFTLTLKSISLGQKNDRYFMSVSGVLDFQAQGGFIGDNLPKAIEIKELIIWEDGSFELAGGGSLVLPKAVSLKLGPATISVTAIHIGSHEQMHNGQLRKYKYFGFDGGLNVNPGGIDARGDGIKFYFTSDNGDGKPLHVFIRIQSIRIDLTIPGNVKPEKATLLLAGYLSMKEPTEGNSNSNAATEYIGGVEFTLPKLKMGGSAAMRYRPDLPAWLVDLELNLSKPILLGATGLGIYGFRGLAGQRYVATKAAAGLNETANWYQYYKAKVAPDYKEGIQSSKFEAKEGFSLGAGLTLGTSFDAGYTFSGKLFLLLSLPDIFILQGQAQILKKRIGLDSTNDPPFTAFVAISSQSVEGALAVNYKLPAEGSHAGKIAEFFGLAEMGFFFNNSSAWYFNIGREEPESKRVYAKVLTLFNSSFYLMLSSQGIRAGARSSLEIRKRFGPLKAELKAYLDLSGRISFKPFQIGGAIEVGGEVKLSIFRFRFYISASVTLAAEAPKPFIVTGTLKVCIRVLRKKRCAKFSLTWTFNEHLDDSEVELLKRSNLNESVKALHIPSGQTFDIFTTESSSIPNPSTWGGTDQYTIPMDSFIDIYFNKGLKPQNGDATLQQIGGVTQAAKYVDYIPPQKGKSEQVKHEYHLKKVEIMSWDSDSGSWKPYHIYEAASPLGDLTDYDAAEVATLKQAYWQLVHPNTYNTLRVLAQDPFSYVQEGMILEDLGITIETIFCVDKTIEKTCVDFEGIDLQGGDSVLLIPSNTPKFHEGLLMRIIDGAGHVVTESFGDFNQALEIPAGAELEILFSRRMACSDLLFQTAADKVKVQYYRRVLTVIPDFAGLPEVTYELIHETEVNATDLNESISYESGTDLVDKIIVKSIGGSGGTSESQLKWKWARKLRRYASQDYENMAVDQANNVYVAGSFSHTFHIGGETLISAGNDDIYLVKYNSEGEAQWVRQLRGTTQNDRALGLVADAAGNVYLTGFFSNQIQIEDGFLTNPNSQRSALLVKYDTDGNFEWAKQGAGIAYNVLSECVSVSENGRVSILGRFSDTITFEGTTLQQTGAAEDIFLTQYAADGTFMWAIKAVGSTSGGYISNGEKLDIRIDEQNATYITGSFSNEIQIGNSSFTSSGNHDIFLAKFDANGQKVWAKTFGQTGKEVARSIALDGDGNCYITGYFGNSLNIDGIQLTATNSLESVFIAKFASDGSIQWAKNSDSPVVNSYAKGYSIDVDELGNSYITGHFRKGMSFAGEELRAAPFSAQSLIVEEEPSLESPLAPPVDGDDGGGGSTEIITENDLSYQAFIVKHDTDGNFIWGKTVGDVGTDIGTEIIVHPTEQVLYFRAYSDKGFLLAEDILVSAGAYVAKLSVSSALQLYQSCHLTYKDYLFNNTAPSTEELSEASQNMVAGINKYIQPVWRPYTTYAIRIETEDQLDANEGSLGTSLYNRSYIFGFKTAGPVGHFHHFVKENGNRDYRDDYKALQQIDQEDTYPLANLKHYIDYQKSYPNADGKLTNAKPLFYESPKLGLFFKYAYIYTMFNTWNSYQGTDAWEAQLQVILKDPAEPLNEQGEASLAIPPFAAAWQEDNIPTVQNNIEILHNLIQQIEAGDLCVSDIDVTEPIGVHSELEPPVSLQPSKTYTALFIAQLKKDTDSDFMEEEVHRYVFQTSRYPNFEAQVNSYLLKDDAGVVQQKAFFEINQAFDSSDLTKAQAVLENTLNENDPLIQQFALPFDRLIDGVLQLGSLPAATTTEFNIIKDTNTDNILGILVRNPEPFNDPKIPADKLKDTLLFAAGGGSKDGAMVLFSKDTSQAFVTNADFTLNVPSSDWQFAFSYLTFNGETYITEGSQIFVSYP